MRKLWLYIGLGVLGVLVLLLVAFFWLVDTTAGARFAVSALSGSAGYRISVQKVEGRLLDRLHLGGVRVTRPKFRAEIDSVDLDWEPRQLLSRDLLVRELSISGVRIQDDQPPSEKAPQLHWPRLSGGMRSVTATISRLKLRGLSYRHLQATPQLVTEFSAAAHFSNGSLSISDLVLLSPDGRVSGEIVVGGWRQALRLDLALVPARPIQEMDLISLQARLLPGRDPEQIAGIIAIAGRSGATQRLELTGELGLIETGFNLRRVSLIRPGRRGTLTGSGTITLTKSQPLFSLALKASELDLARDLKLPNPTSLSGTLSFNGNISSFLGDFALANSGPGWQDAALAAHYRGDPAGVKLSGISGKLLEGSLHGALDIALSHGTRVSGALQGRGLNPERFVAGWPGRINLDLAGDLELPKQGELSGKLRGKLLESRLRGQDLHGDAAAGFAGKRLRIDQLFLAGRGFDLKGAGELDRRLNLSARVSDLSGLVPGAAGEFQADGWVRWRDGILSGVAAGEGRNLAAAGMRAGAFQLKASLGEGEGYPVQLEASLRRVGVGRVQMEQALVTLTGNAARHTLNAELSSPASQAQVTLSGGYAGGVWRGAISRLSGRDAIGPWSLAAPAPLEVSAGGFRLAPLVLNGLPGERVELAGAMRLHPGSGEFRGNWRGVNLARINGWLEGEQLTGESSGDLSLRLLPDRHIVLSGRADASGTLVADGRRVELERLTASVEGGARGLDAALDLTLKKARGGAQLRFKSRAPATLALPRQGDLSLQWSDLDLALLAPYTPRNLALQGRLSGGATGKLLPGGRLDAKGNASLGKGHVNWREQGEEFDASIDTAELSFDWRGGRLGAGKGGAGVLKLSAQAAATGSYTAKGERIELSRGTLRADADQNGTRARFDLELKDGGTLRAAVSSASPAGLGMPETGDLILEWGGINPVHLKPFLPGELNLEGEFAGDAHGRLLPGKRLELKGAAQFSQGKAKWQGTGGEVNANLRSASLAFDWRGETLSATLDLALAEYGKAQGSFRLPVPARLPVVANQNGPLQGTLAGKVQEHGFLTLFLPGVVQESHGDLDLDLRIGGTLGDPRLSGTLQLAKAGAYLPAAGIRVSDLQLMARLEGDKVRIENFKAVSGPGHIEGSVLLQLKGWQVVGYSGNLSGERFQTVYLPELQMTTSPKLSFEGGAESATVSGELRVPEMLISGPPVRSIVTPSKDVILEGAPPQTEQKKFPIVVNGVIHVVLGDKVQVKASGIDATLGGGMDLVLKGMENISSSGEISVVKGSYKAYGMDLDIVRGRLYYVNEPVNQPTLDILALRTVGDVRAGVTVAGFLSAPIVKLYSEPSMPEVDILAYMVLGHPLGASSEQGGMVAMAASSLFSLGQSESLQEQIKERLGLSVLGVETVNTSRAGLMGYKEIATTPTGGAPAKPAAGQSLLTVGKYLTPKLYISYGRSLVTGGSLFMLRYDVFRHWQLETQSGSESGADIYYKLEFN